MRSIEVTRYEDRLEVEFYDRNDFSMGTLRMDAESWADFMLNLRDDHELTIVYRPGTDKASLLERGRTPRAAPSGREESEAWWRLRPHEYVEGAVTAQLPADEGQPWETQPVKLCSRCGAVPTHSVHMPMVEEPSRAVEGM